MKTYLTSEQAVNLLINALPGPKIQLIEVKNDSIRFEWYNAKFYFSFEYLSIEQMDPPGILASNLTTSLMQHILKIEFSKSHKIE